MFAVGPRSPTDHQQQRKLHQRRSTEPTGSQKVDQQGDQCSQCRPPLNRWIGAHGRQACPGHDEAHRHEGQPCVEATFQKPVRCHGQYEPEDTPQGDDSGRGVPAPLPTGVGRRCGFAFAATSQEQADTRDQSGQTDQAGGGGGFQEKIVWVGDLLAQLLELVRQVVLAEVPRTGAHQGAVGDHSQGALPVFEPVGQRLGGFGEDLAVNPSGPEGGHHQQHRDGGSQGDAAGTFLHPSQRPFPHQQHATGREAHPGRATLGQQQAVGDQ